MLWIGSRAKTQQNQILYISIEISCGAPHRKSKLLYVGLVFCKSFASAFAALPHLPDPFALLRWSPIPYGVQASFGLQSLIVTTWVTQMGQLRTNFTKPPVSKPSCPQFNTLCLCCFHFLWLLKLLQILMMCHAHSLHEDVFWLCKAGDGICEEGFRCVSRISKFGRCPSLKLQRHSNTLVILGHNQTYLPTFLHEAVSSCWQALAIGDRLMLARRR